MMSPYDFYFPMTMMVAGILEAVFTFLGFLFSGLAQMFFFGGSEF